MYFCLNLEKENKPQHFVGDRRLLAHPGEAVWHDRLVPEALVSQIYFFYCSIYFIFLSSGSCNRNVCSVCLFSNRYLKIWGCVLLLTLNYSLTDLSVSQRMHVERGFSKDVYAECLLSL